MAENYTELRKALEAGPIEGRWFAQRDYSSWVVRNGDLAKNGMFRRLAAIGSPGIARLKTPQLERESQCTAEYIVAANPATIRALLNERDRLAKDAERYQWLRERYGRLAESYTDDGDRIARMRVLTDRDVEAGCGWDVNPESLDAAIDAAMGEAKGGKS